MSSIPTGGNIFAETFRNFLMLILYKSGRNVRFVLFAETSIVKVEPIIILSSKTSLEMGSSKMCKDSSIFMEIKTFNRLRPGLKFPWRIIASWITGKKVTEVMKIEVVCFM